MTDPLLSSRIRDALAGLSLDLDPLAAATALRRRLPPELAREAAQLHALRRRGRGKLEDAARLLLTEKGLEQASHRLVAAARAARFARHGEGIVLDATAGIGSDCRALAEAGLRVVAADRDPRLASLLQANLAGCEGIAVLRAAADRPPLRPDLLLLDPDRREAAEGGGLRRIGDPARWSPPWARCRELAESVRGACVELAPATDIDRLDPPPTEELPHAWQWISLQGELKSVDLWTGVLAEAGDAPGLRQVLALDGRGGAAAFEGEPQRAIPLGPEAAAEVAWIAAPDPALIRSGLLGTLAREEGLRPLGPEIAFLGGDHAPRSPLFAGYRVLASASLDRKRVRAMLAAHDVGRITVKKRGHPETASQLAQRLRGSGKRRGILVVSRLAQGHRAWLVEAVKRAETGPPSPPPAQGGTPNGRNG